MFGFLKDKLKSALGAFTKGVKENAKVEEKVVEKAPEPKKEVPKPVQKKEAPRKEEKKPEPKKEVPKPAPKKEVFPAKESRFSGVKITYYVHGTTTDNEKEIATGWNPGELSEKGIEQAKELRKHANGKSFAAVFCSDLKRAVDSAELGFQDKYSTILDKRLREADYGEYAGHHFSFKNELEMYIFKTFPGGECYKDVELRVAEFLNDALKKYSGKHIAIVAHQAPQLALDVLLKNKSWTQAIKEDWRLRKAWQPGWEYSIEYPIDIEEIRAELADKKIIQEKKEEPKKQGFFSKLFGKKEEKAEELKILEEEERLEDDILDKVEIKKVEEKVAEEIFEEEAEEEGEEEAEEEIEKRQGFEVEEEEKPIKEFIEEKKPSPPKEIPKPYVPPKAPEPKYVPPPKKQEIPVQKKEQPKVEPKKEEPEVEEEKKGFFQRIKETFTTIHLSDEKFEEIFWDLEVALLENNVAVEVIEKIKLDLREELTTGRVARGKVEDIILARLKKSIEELFDVESFDLMKRIKEKGEKPYIIAMIGVNGSGKTTSLAKLIHLLKKHKLSCVVAASDTFRAAAIQQLEEHTMKLGVTLIKHDYHSDPAAVAFDAVAHARAKGIDVVLIDTAGRLHSNTNLMRELEKLIRVNKPDLKIFVGESITGNDCVEQARVYNDLVGIDAIILAKADIDEKGGAAVSVSYITKKPIIYLGTGQTYDDLKPFDKDEILRNLGLA